MDADRYARASRVGQRVISAWVPLAVDGKWGRFTQGAYRALSPERRSVVDAALAAEGSTAAGLMAYRDTVRSEASAAIRAASSSRVSVDQAIELAAKEAGIDSGVLRGFVAIESNFNPDARNGSSRGLGQVQPAAWSDVQKRIELPAYDSMVNGKMAVFDPLLNARATATYLRINRERLMRLGVANPSLAQLYLAHQQGAGGFAELFTVATGGKPKTNYVTTERMIQNPPQDGKGATTDKGEFYRRWIAAADRKIAKAMA